MISPLNHAALLRKKCRRQIDDLADAALPPYLAAVEGWVLQDGRLCRSFPFKNYYQTLAFVNAIAYLIHAEDHHPELIVTYQSCLVKYHTHSAHAGSGGITENDFICAAKINAIFQKTERP